MTEISIRIPASAKPSGKAAFVMLGTGFDEIEALAPVDVMRRGGMEVYTVSMTDNRLVKGATGNLVVADMAFSDMNTEKADWLIFPGADKSEAAVNIGKELQALVLGPLGIIKDTEATGYPFLKDDFEKNGGKYSEDAVVTGERLITSKGPGTTLEFALAIVRKAKGEEIEKALRAGMVICGCDCGDNCDCGCK